MKDSDEWCSQGITFHAIQARRLAGIGSSTRVLFHTTATRIPMSPNKALARSMHVCTDDNSGFLGPKFAIALRMATICHAACDLARLGLSGCTGCGFWEERPLSTGQVLVSSVECDLCNA